MITDDKQKDKKYKKKDRKAEKQKKHKKIEPSNYIFIRVCLSYLDFIPPRNVFQAYDPFPRQLY